MNVAPSAEFFLIAAEPGRRATPSQDPGEKSHLTLHAPLSTELIPQSQRSPKQQTCPTPFQPGQSRLDLLRGGEEGTTCQLPRDRRSGTRLLPQPYLPRTEVQCCGPGGQRSAARATHTNGRGSGGEPAERLSRALVGWEDTGEEDCSAALPPPLPTETSSRHAQVVRG